jgi:GT2 family glycosyltransferase
MNRFVGPVELSIVIVSWNVCDLLRACLASIEASREDLRVEVIVVDGGSNDGSPEMVRVAFPEVELVVKKENLGFPKGNNIGISRSSGRYVMLLNPDTEVVDEALGEMLAFADAHPDVGVIGAQLLNPDGSVQSSRRRFPTLATGVFESTWLQPIAPKSILRYFYVEDLPDDKVTDVDWVTGACLLARRDVVDAVGLLDEDYFMYSEELDWCRRIKDAGWRVVYFPAAQIIHHVGKSSEQAVTERHINFQRAKLRYFRKYHGRWAAKFLRLLLIANFLWQMSLEAAKALLGNRRVLRWQRVQAYWRVLRSGLRPAGY